MTLAYQHLSPPQVHLEEGSLVYRLVYPSRGDHSPLQDVLRYSLKPPHRGEDKIVISYE